MLILFFRLFLLSFLDDLRGMVLKIQGKVPFALDESRDNKTWHQQVKEASEWKMKHTRI